MSKIILHGGDTTFSHIESLWFWRAIADAVESNDIAVLSIAFAMSVPKDGIPDKFFDQTEAQCALSVKSHLMYVNPHKNIAVIPASSDLDILLKQISNVDVVFIHGGNGDNLQNYLNPIRQKFVKVMRDKVGVGNSAGANIFSQKYYSNDNKAVCDGFGIIPTATFCHYNTSKWAKLNELIKDVDTNHVAVIPLGNDEFIEY